MGIGALDYKKGGAGLDINGIIEDYYVYAGENVSAGDFVEFVNGVASSSIETSSAKIIDGTTSVKTGYNSQACKLSESKVFVAYSVFKDLDNSSLWGVVCTINGATITAGTSVQIGQDTNAGVWFSIDALSETSVFLVYRYASSKVVRVRICTIDGSVIIANVYTSIASPMKVCEGVTAKALSDTNVFVAYHQNNSNGYYIYSIICTVDSTSVTAGTSQLSVSRSTSNYGLNISSELLSDNKIFIVLSSKTAGYYLTACVCTVSGTTTTWGDARTLNSSANTGYITSTTVLSPEKVFVAYGSWDGTVWKPNGIICTISGTEVSNGSTKVISGIGLSKIEVGKRKNSPFISSELLANGNVYVAYGTNSGLYASICTVTGTSITVGNATQLNSDTNSGYGVASVILGNDKIFQISSSTTSHEVTGQVFKIENGVPTNVINETEYETQVRKATTLPCDGVAKSSGEGGDETVHKDVVSVYVSDV